MTRYLAATRHPWASLMFVLPLLVAYEAGVVYFGGDNTNTLRNGADVWLRWVLERYGLVQVWIAPAAVALVLLIQSWFNWSSRPREPLATSFGMVLESLLFAVGLWAIARNFDPLMSQIGLPVTSISFRTPAAGQVVTYVGAGIYEEVLFRLGLFTLVFLLLRKVALPTLPAALLAGVGAAVTFAAAHHVGPHGEEIVPAKFLFRTLAGIYFTILYILRGFGIAVGAHAGYDVLVGVAVG